MKLMTLRRSLAERSRSANLVLAVAHGPMKGFQPDQILVFAITAPQIDYVLKVVGSKVKVVVRPDLTNKSEALGPALYL